VNDALGGRSCAVIGSQAQLTRRVMGACVPRHCQCAEHCPEWTCGVEAGGLVGSFRVSGYARAVMQRLRTASRNLRQCPEGDEAKGDEAESDEAESDEAESDEAESDEAESDEPERTRRLLA